GEPVLHHARLSSPTRRSSDLRWSPRSNTTALCREGGEAMAPTILSARRAARATALGALTVALVAGCGSTSDEGTDTAPPADGSGTSQEGDGASQSDGGGGDATPEEPADEGAGTAASDGGGDSDGGGTAAGAGDEPLPADADLATAELPISAEKAIEIGREEAGGGDLVQIEI